MLIDISWPITPCITEYKNRSTVQLKQLKTVEKDGVCETLLTFHNHSGTHIDAPAHFIADGKTLDQFSLTTFVGPCKVLDVTYVQEKITDKDLKPFLIQGGDRILLKTCNSQRAIDEPFDDHFVYLASSGARFLADCRVQLVGIDYLGIERNQPAHETHMTLLAQDIPILEGLRLREVEAGIYYTLICLPLHVPGSDAVPARAVLL